MQEIPVLFDKSEDCCGCMACVNVCPKDAISVETDENGFTFPQINPELCIRCGSCERVCDYKKPAETEIKRTEPISCWGVVNRDRKNLKFSASGGVFPAVADWILKQGGVVAGCVMDEGFYPRHICSDKQCDINRMRGSKYVQSEIGLTYREVKTYLKDGRYVLFTGTPCQVAGLYSYLGGRDKYEHLFTIDVICHGVPNAVNMRKFLKHISVREGGEVTGITFRSKTMGWGFPYAKIDIKKGGKTNAYYMGRNEEYFIDFLNGHLKRDADFTCKYASTNRVGDMTMGDFWGWMRADIKLKWDKGLSVLFVNTPKAEPLLEQLGFEKQQVKLSQTLANPALNGREKQPLDADREGVLRLYREDLLERRYPPRTTKNKLKHWVRYHIPFPMTIVLKERIKSLLRKTGIRR